MIRRTRAARSALGALGALCVWAGGCRPDLGERDSLVEAPRILAVRGEPAEARPGDTVTYTALVASPDGSAITTLRWATCVTPKPLAEPSIVAAACLGDDGVEPGSDPGDAGDVATLALPADACSLFGPEPPPGGYRPRDPDPTGGYYVPIRASLGAPGTSDTRGADAAFQLERVGCSLGDAPVELARTFARTYVANLNPASPSVVLSREGAVVAEGGAVARAAALEIAVAWRAEDAETYVYFDRPSQTLTTKREWMRVSWFASAGSFAVDHAGADERAEGDGATTLSNAWMAPVSAGPVHFWVVLRDARGGVAWTTRELEVQ